MTFKKRLAIVVLAISVPGLLLMAIYTKRVLYQDLVRISGEQQFEVTSTLAARLDEEVADRFRSLDIVASEINSEWLHQPVTLQKMLDQRPVFQRLFNEGVFFTSHDRQFISEPPWFPLQNEISDMRRDFPADAVSGGSSKLSPPIFDQRLRAVVFVMAVPIHDDENKVIGSLAGITNLGKPNFLERVVGNRSGTIADYVVVAPKHRRVVDASNKALIGKSLPGPDRTGWMDRGALGEEGHFLSANQFGAEILSSTRRIPTADWYLSVSQSTDIAFARMNDLQLHLLFGTLFLAFATAGIVWWMIRRRLAPMKSMVRMLATVSGADRTPNAPISTVEGEGCDLLGDLNNLLKNFAQREVALQKFEQRSSPGTIIAVYWEVWWGLDGKPYWISPSVEKYTGYSVSECMAMPDFVGTLIHPEDMSVVRPAMRQGLLGLSGEGLEFRIVNKSGALTWLSLSWLPIHDISGSFRGVRTSGHDITSRKRTEAKLLETERMFSEILDNVHAHIYLKDKKGRYFFINKSMHDFFGIASFEESTQRHGIYYDMNKVQEVRRRFFTPEVIEQMRANDRLVFEKGKPVKSEDHMHTEDGRIMVFSTVKHPLRNESGEIYAMCGISTDVTERKTVEMALTASELRLKAESASKTLFLAKMSHELRTPLDTILGNAQLLTRPNSQALWQDGLASIQRSGWHLLGMIDEILDHARGASGNLPIEPAVVDLHIFLRDVAQNGHLLAVTNHNEFSLVPSGDLMQTAMMDERRVQQVLDNLLANAARYTRDGRIRLSVATTRQTGGGARLEFSVTDSGEGIPLADQERIFLPFERGLTNGRAGGKGTGMGLTISRQLAEAMGGELTVTSTFGEGACFSFWLPIDCPNQLEATPDSETELQHLAYTGPRRTVMVVNNEPANRNVWRVLLENSGFVVVEAHSCQSAARVLDRKLVVDLVVTDKCMDDGDGWAVLQNIAAVWPNVPVILIAAATSKAPPNFPEAIGFSAHFLKPLNHSEFLRRIGELLKLEWISPDSALHLDKTIPDFPPHLLKLEDLRILNGMIVAGQVSNIMTWADELKARQPELEEFADAIKMAARMLDFPLLTTLASPEKN